MLLLSAYKGQLQSYAARFFSVLSLAEHYGKVLDMVQ